MRGGFFGGSARAVAWFHNTYDVLLRETLSLGWMGTEESVFTIVRERFPDRFNNDEVEFSRKFVCKKLHQLRMKCT